MRTLRLSRHLPLADVAKAVGISVGFLSAIERSHMSASVGTLRKLAYFYGLNILDFFDPAQANPYKVRSSGEVKYQHFIVDPGFKEDKWIKAVEAKAGNRSVVHHIIVAVAPIGSLAGLDDNAQRSEWLTAMAPGKSPLIWRVSVKQDSKPGS